MRLLGLAGSIILPRLSLRQQRVQFLLNLVCAISIGVVSRRGQHVGILGVLAPVSVVGTAAQDAFFVANVLCVSAKDQAGGVV